MGISRGMQYGARRFPRAHTADHPHQLADDTTHRGFERTRPVARRRCDDNGRAAVAGKLDSTSLVQAEACVTHALEPNAHARGEPAQTPRRLANALDGR